jgi:hypothetical protein
MRRIFRLSLLLPFVAAACGSENGSRDTALVTDSAGVRIVANSGPDVPLDWHLEPEFTLGGADEGPEAFYDVNGNTIGSDSASRLYVLDRGGHRIIVFDAAGRHVRSMGREGRGPGELALPWGLSVRPDGTVLVDDFGKGGLVGFDPSGTALPSDEAALPGSLRVWVGNGLYSDVRAPATDGKAEQRFVYVVEGDTTDLVRLAREDADRIVELASCGMSFGGMPPIFAPDIAWHAGPAGAVVRSGPAYRIEVYEGDRLVGRYTRDVRPLPSTTDLARREIGEGMTMVTPGGPLQCETSEVVEQRGVAPELPVIRNLRIAPDGTIWVSRGGPRPERTPTDILSADGTYLGTLSAEIPYPIGFLADGRALFAETDELDVSRLAVYRVEESGGREQ